MATFSKRGLLSNSMLALVVGPAVAADRGRSAASPDLSSFQRGLGQIIDRAPGQATRSESNALDEALEQAGLAGNDWPSVVLGAGEFDLGGESHLIASHAARLMGLSIDSSRLFGSGRPTLRSRNYAGRIADLSLFGGKPGQDGPAGRSTQADGLLLDWTGGHGEVRNVQANNFNGYGIRFNNIWDALVENIIVVNCGNDQSYALEVRSAGDTSNHTLFSRVQVEDSHGRAMLFDAANINLIVDGIHSEGTVGNGVDFTHQFLGGFCSYRNARIANDGGGVRVRLGGGRNSYRDMWFQNGVYAEYNWGSEEPQFRSLIDNCMFDVLRVPATNAGKLTIRDSYINRLHVENQAVGTVRLQNCDVANLQISGNPQAVVT